MKDQTVKAPKSGKPKSDEVREKDEGKEDELVRALVGLLKELDRLE